MLFKPKTPLEAVLSAALVAVSVNAALFLVFSQLGWIVVLPRSPQQVGFLQIVFATLFGCVGALVGYFTMRHLLKVPFKVFIALSVVFLGTSLASPLALPGVPPKMVIALDTMHLVVAGSLMYFFAKADRHQ